MAGMTGSRDWAVQIAERVEAGERVARIAVDYATDVLKRPILRGGKHASRPDTKDRQANDAHQYADDERVAI